MPYLVIWLLLCSFPTLLHAQEDYLDLSPLKERERTSRTYTLLNYDSSGYYVLRFNRALSYAELEQYDSAQNFKKTYVVTKQKRKYVGVLNIRDYLAVLYFEYKENRITKTHVNVRLKAKRLHPETYHQEEESEQ